MLRKEKLRKVLTAMVEDWRRVGDGREEEGM